MLRPKLTVQGVGHIIPVIQISKFQITCVWCLGSLPRVVLRSSGLQRYLMQLARRTLLVYSLSSCRGSFMSLAFCGSGSTANYRRFLSLLRTYFAALSLQTSKLKRVLNPETRRWSAVMIPLVHLSPSMQSAS